MKKSKTASILWTVTGVAICFFLLAIGVYFGFTQTKQAQMKILDYLYNSLDPFPDINQMPYYGEFYLSDGDDEYLIVKKGDTIISAKRNTSGTTYYEASVCSDENILYSNEQKDIWKTIQEAVSLRLTDNASYICKKNRGPWQLRIMPDSEWVVTGKRTNHPGTELITYTENESIERVGWVVYKEDSIVMYVYLSSASIVTEGSPQHVFGWGSIELNCRFHQNNDT